MSDDSEWRYSVDEVDTIHEHESTKLELFLAGATVVGLSILLLAIVTSPSFTQQPQLTMNDTDRGTELTVTELPYRHTKLTVLTPNSTITITKERTLTIPNTTQENITIKTTKMMYDGMYTVNTRNKTLT